MLSFKKIYRFYADGFKSMTVGRKLWLLIIIKLIVIFGILKLFFFDDFVARRAESQDTDGATIVRNELINRR